jgi:hypothetical protein
MVALVCLILTNRTGRSRRSIWVGLMARSFAGKSGSSSPWQRS